MRVLVADDEPEVRAVLARMLGALGHRADLAPDGWELLRLAGASEPDLVLSDVDMPGCDGIRAGKLLRRARPALPLLLMTGDPESARAARLAGFGPVLLKPFSLSELAAALALASP